MGEIKKMYNAKVVDDGSVVQQKATSNEDEPLAMELANPATAEAQRSTHEERQPALIDRMECLAADSNADGHQQIKVCSRWSRRPAYNGRARKCTCISSASRGTDTDSRFLDTTTVF